MLEAFLIISVALNIYLLIRYVLTDRVSSRTGLSDIIADGLSHDDARVVKMTVLLTLSARLAKADGKILGVEKEIVNKHLGLGQGDLKTSNELFEAACDSKIPNDDLIRALKKLYPTHNERRQVIELLRQIAWSDDEYHGNEEELVRLIAEKIGVDLN